MKYHTFSLFLFGLAIFAAGQPSANAQTVTGAFDGRITRGKAAKGKIFLAIPEGLHVNSNKPESEYAIPTTVRISEQGFKLGAIEYPEGTSRKFQFSDEPLNVYEGEITIPFTITVPRNFRGTTLSLKAIVRYQACTDEVCYPPKNKEIVMTASLK